MVTRIKLPIKQLTTEQTSALIEAIARDKEAGYRFSFFLGAGISRSAGYPLPMHLSKHYLPYCIVRSLGLDPMATEPKPGPLPRWDPSSHPWPRMEEEVAHQWSLASEKEIKKERPSASRLPGGDLPDVTVLTSLLVGLLGRPGKVVIPPLSPKLDRQLIASALGDMQEWRRSLRFLCSLREVNGKLLLGRPDYAVQDGLFQHLLDDCDPAQTHRMIASLAPVLKCDRLITTNFDDLIERSFAAMSLRLTPYEVARPAPLPGAAAMRLLRSLVKINGGRFSLVADDTLDAAPSEDDVSQFIGYLTGAANPEEAQRAKAAVIVAGVGGTELRTLTLIRHAMARLERLHVYWIEFSGDRQATKAFNKAINIQHGINPPAMNRAFWRLPHPEQGLLFQQLYTHLTGDLPNSGVVFPGLWRLPLPPIIPAPPKGTPNDDPSELQKGIRAALDDEKAKYRMVIAISPHPESAGRRACCRLFAEIRSAAWLDMVQVGHPWGIMLRIILMAARLHGTAVAPTALDFSRWRADMLPDERDSFLNTMKNLLRRYRARLFDTLTIFINGLDEPAKQAPWAANSSAVQEEYKKPQTLAAIWHCLHELAKDETCGVRFVITGSTTSYRSRESLSDDPTVGLSLAAWKKSKPERVCWLNEKKAPVRIMQERLRAAVAWMEENQKESRAAFICMLCEMRHARHVEPVMRVFARFAEASGLAGYDEAMSLARGWITTLVKGTFTLREKLGGLLWMHPRLKAQLLEASSQQFKACAGKSYALRRIILGNFTARHYGRQLLVTSDPLAALELIHHVIHACESLATEGAAIMAPEVRQQLHHILRHSWVALRMARPVLERQLSSDLAEAAMEGLEGQLRRLHDNMRRKFRGKQRDALDRTFYELRLELTMAEGELMIRSARSHSENVKRWTDNNAKLIPEASNAMRMQKKTASGKGVSRGDSKALKVVGAHILARRHKVAEPLLKKLWKDLASHLGTSTSDVLLSPLPVLWAKKNSDSMKDFRGEALARKWLLAALEASPAMSDADMENWRTYLVRACHWTAMFLLNRAQIEWLKNSNEGKGADKKDEFTAQLLASRWYSTFGLEVVRTVDHTRGNAAVHDQVRLRCLAAIALALIPTTAHENPAVVIADGSQRHLSMLSDARSFVEDFPFGDAEIERAIISLRTAEVLLISIWNTSAFKELRETLWRNRSVLTTKTTAAEGARVCQETIARGSFALSLTMPIVDEVGEHLSNALQILRRHPKSTWWISYLWALKARLVEVYYTLRLGHKSDGGDEFHIPTHIRSEARSDIFSAIYLNGITDLLRLSRIVRCLHRTSLAWLADHVSSPNSDPLFNQFVEQMAVLIQRLQVQIDGAKEKTGNNAVDSNLLTYAEGVLNTAKEDLQRAAPKTLPTRRKRGRSI